MHKHAIGRVLIWVIERKSKGWIAEWSVGWLIDWVIGSLVGDSKMRKLDL